MPFELIFKGYWGTELRIEEHHFFSDLKGLNRYAAWRIDFLSYEKPCNRYDIQVKVSFDEEPPVAA